MLSYIIVGSGYRSEYYARVARTYPHLFRAMYLCRTPEKAALMRQRTGLEAAVTPEECLAFEPDFAVIAVDRGHMAEVTAEWAARGLPVAAETPVGDTPEKLRVLRRLAAEGAKITCCEQYIRQPVLAAGLRAVNGGLIGEPASMYISLLHDYHAASLIRHALGVASGEAYTLRGISRISPVTETDSRAGAILDGRETGEKRDTVHISFASGKEAIYDFSPVQYRSYIRTRHLTVRGTRGEWSDTLVLHLDGENRPQRTFLMAELPEKYRVLDTQALRDRRRNWQAELAPDTVQDEFAIASFLLDMGEWLKGGPSPYPLEEALEDARFWLLLNQAVSNPWQEISSELKSWK